MASQELNLNSDKVKTLSVLEMNGETYSIVIDLAINQVYGVKKDRKGTVDGVFKKGAGRTTLFAAVEIARRLANKKKQDGWKETESKFAEFGNEVFEDETGAKKSKAGKKESGERPVAWFLTIPLPELALRMKQELMAAGKEQTRQKDAALRASMDLETAKNLEAEKPEAE